MTTPRVPIFRIWIPEGYEPLADEARELFARHGMLLEVQERGAPDLDLNSLLQVVASFVIVGPATAFLSAFAAEAGKDAYRALRSFLLAHRGKKPKAELVMLLDTEAHLRILMTDDLPDEALRKLFDLDVAALGGRDDVALGWNADHSSWELQKYPVRRTDVFGWFAGPPTREDPRVFWHWTADPNSSPIMTLCKQRLESPPYSPVLQGQNCHRCMMVDSVNASGVIPLNWDVERADWKRPEVM